MATCTKSTLVNCVNPHCNKAIFDSPAVLLLTTNTCPQWLGQRPTKDLLLQKGLDKCKEIMRILERDKRRRAMLLQEKAKRRRAEMLLVFGNNKGLHTRIGRHTDIDLAQLPCAKSAAIRRAQTFCLGKRPLQGSPRNQRDCLTEIVGW